MQFYVVNAKRGRWCVEKKDVVAGRDGNADDEALASVQLDTEVRFQ